MIAVERLPNIMALFIIGILLMVLSSGLLPFKQTRIDGLSNH